jgi:hypothetical protein
MDTTQSIISTKQRRKDIDAVITAVQELPASRETSLAITKLQEAVMWLGMNLKRINEMTPGASPNPYPNSRDTSNTVIDQTADGLRLGGQPVVPAVDNANVAEGCEKFSEPSPTPQNPTPPTP